jgi:hypothetical protein
MIFAILLLINIEILFFYINFYLLIQVFLKLYSFIFICLVSYLQKNLNSKTTYILFFLFLNNYSQFNPFQLNFYSNSKIINFILLKHILKLMKNYLMIQYFHSSFNFNYIPNPFLHNKNHSF